MRARAGIVAGLALVAWSTTSGTATAKPGLDPIDQQCGEDSFQVVVQGRGNWTSGRIVGGGLFIPTAFGTFTGTVRAPDGTIVDEFAEDPDQKGNSAKNKDVVDCTFSFTEVFPDGFSVHGEGEISGYFVGR